MGSPLYRYHRSGIRSLTLGRGSKVHGGEWTIGSFRGVNCPAVDTGDIFEGGTASVVSVADTYITTFVAGMGASDGGRSPERGGPEVP